MVISAYINQVGKNASNVFSLTLTSPKQQCNKKPQVYSSFIHSFTVAYKLTLGLLDFSQSGPLFPKC